MPENFGLPTGLSHFELIARGVEVTSGQSNGDLKSHRAELELIGTALCALYQAATCHRKCHGGPHVLESLSARAYNLSVAAYNLTLLGFYDEALNLIRGIGEIANLVLMSVVDKPAYMEWLASDKQTRLRKFKPSDIRVLIEKSGGVPIIADRDWYSEFCEKYVHVTPQTKPNMHNDKTPMAGGIYQENGLATSLSELATMTTSLAVLICKYFKLDDLYNDLLTSERSDAHDK